MGRIRRYQVGDTVNNYRIAARSEDSRVVWVNCQHPGCNQTHKVFLSAVIQGAARKFCDMHKDANLQQRRMERMRDRHMMASIEAAARKEQSTPDMRPVTGTVREGVDFRMMLDSAAVRVARELNGLPWRGYVNEGRCFGWYIVQERNQTLQGAVRWSATCAVCGTGRMLYDAQLKREEANRCPHCMRPRGRYELAQSLYRRAVEMGHNLHDPLTLLHVANRLARGFEDDGCLKWTADAYVTFRKMVEWEEQQLATEDRVDLPPIEEETVDWWEVPLDQWPYAAVEATAIDMHKNPAPYVSKFGVQWMMKNAEVRNELRKRDEARKESGDDAV